MTGAYQSIILDRLNSGPIFSVLNSPMLTDSKTRYTRNCNCLSNEGSALMASTRDLKHLYAHCRSADHGNDLLSIEFGSRIYPYYLPQGSNENSKVEWGL